MAIPQLADAECVGEFMPLGERRGRAFGRSLVRAAFGDISAGLGCYSAG
jgi:hypothetical protein